MRPEIVAHRLGAAYGPDSSGAALERSLAGGVDGLETDVCLTADSGLVLLHDPLLPLGTTLEGWAHERAADEILACRLRGRDGAPTDQSPLALAAFLERVPPAVTLKLEVKGHADTDLARRTAEALCDFCRDQRDRVEIISFHTSACEVAARAGYRSRLVLFADYRPDALSAWVRGRGITGVSIEHFLLGEELVGSLRDADIGIATGTVNAPELVRRVMAFAPDYVCTDVPHEARLWAREPVAGTALGHRVS